MRRFHVTLFALVAGAVGAPADPVLFFSEQAAAAGVAAPQTPPPGVLTNIMVGSAAVGDFNRDGWQDLFMLTGGGAPDRLYLNRGDGAFDEVAADWGVAETHVAMGIAVGDYDRDGWLDMFVSAGGYDGTEPGRNKLYRNLGGYGFEDVAALAGVQWTAPGPGDGWGAVFGDYDLDGDLDLFVGGYVFNRGGNRLFRNEGDGTFTDVTASAILFDLDSSTHSFSPRLVDMDGDRYPELLIAGDFITSRYMINNRDGTFTEATRAAGVGLDFNGMGNTVGDFNNDGLPDWYVTAIYNPASEVQPGNMLYLNNGGHRFREVGVSAGVNQGGWGWGAAAVDFDHDGRQDLIATNGWPGAFGLDPTYLWLNRGDETFVSSATACGITHNLQGRGLVNFDYDNDGDQDVVIVNLGRETTLLRNDLSGSGANWLRVFLDHNGRRNLAPGGIGARVRATIGGTNHTRWLEAGSNYLGVSELSAHFGLGAATTVDELVVEWPTGEQSVLTGLAANQTLTVSATRLVGDPTADGRVNLSDLGVVLTAFGGCEGDAWFNADADLDDDGCVTLADLTIVIEEYGAALY